MLRATTACTFSTWDGNRIVKKWPEPVVILTFCSKICYAPQHHAFFRHCIFQEWSGLEVFFTCSSENVLRTRTACTFSTSQLPIVVRDRHALPLLTSKCASRHNGAHCCDISSSMSAPRMVSLVHFDFQMCFAPQRRALFPHLNFRKCSEHVVFCPF